MNKVKIFIICLILLLSVSLTSCKNNDLKKIRVAEVAHSVFYAPQYVAINLGYFEEEGLEIELVNANGADKVTSALLSGDVEIGLQGPEPTIYLYNNDLDNYLVNFAQLTQTDGSFIFGREEIKDFEMPIQKYQCGKYCYFSSLFSVTVFPLYGMIIIGLIITGIIIR